MGLHVFTAGTFDILHQDHLNLFRWCRKIAGEYGKVTVAVNGDDFVASFKGKQPVMDLSERMAVVQAIKYVDSVVMNTGEDSLLPVVDAFREGLHPIDVIAIGSDWHARNYLDQIGANWKDLLEREVAITYIPSPNQIHSANIKERMRLLD